MKISTRIKPTLEEMEIGSKAYFPKSRRFSVRTIASDLKVDKGLVFKTRRKDDLIIVERVENKLTIVEQIDEVQC